MRRILTKTGVWFQLEEDDEDERPFGELLDPWDGAVRLTGGVERIDGRWDLPRLDRTYRKRRAFCIQFIDTEAGNGVFSEKWSPSMSAGSARSYLDVRLTRLSVLKKARVYGPRDCYL